MEIDDEIAAPTHSLNSKQKPSPQSAGTNTRTLRPRNRIAASAPQTSKPATAHPSIKTISPTSNPLPYLTQKETLLLKKKQTQLLLTTYPTLPACWNNALFSTLIFAQHSAGTAICISPNGYLLTCAHCFGDTRKEYESSCKKKWLLFPDGKAVLAECLVWDGMRDLALLRIIAAEGPWDGKEFSFVEICPRPVLENGELKMKIICIGQPGSEDLESVSRKKTSYDLVEVSEGKLRGLAPGADPQDNSEIGSLMHDAWTYWGHSGAPLIGVKEGKLVGLHSSWDEETGMRRGVPGVAIWEFLEREVGRELRGRLGIEVGGSGV